MSTTTVAVPQSADLGKLLEEIRADIGVPGVTMSIAAGDEWVEAAAGVAHIGTRQSMLGDTPFLIGSITKTFTTSLVLLLQEQGLIDIEKPITDYLPDIRFADPDLAGEITVRRLLDHSNGIDGGDYAKELGRSDDAIRLLVESCKDLGRLYDPGDMTSYTNVAFVIAGRIAEVVGGKPAAVLQEELLLRPAGLQQTVWLPEDALLRGAATGSYTNEDGVLELPPHWNYPWAVGPCGTILTASAHDLVQFARMHLRGGVAEDGTRVLSEASVKDMQTRRPVKYDTGMSFGLGWNLGKVGDFEAISHGGGSPGGAAFLQAIPERGLVLAAFCNGEGGGSTTEVVRRVNEILLGIEIPKEPEPVGPEVNGDLERFTGKYERWGAKAEVSVGENGVLKVVSDSFGAMHAWLPRTKPSARWTTTMDLPPTGPDKFGSMGTFLDTDDDGTPDYFVFARAHRRVGG
jgi:CubicO group peptidase (beta-lactamase class C family)